MCSSRPILSRLCGDRRGTTAIEFAFVGGIFFVLLLGAIDIARYQFTMQSLRDIAAEAARAALINADLSKIGTATLWSDSQLKSAVTISNPTPFLDPTALTLSTQRSTSSTGVDTITVNVSYPFGFVGPLLPTTQLTLSDSSATSY